MESINYAMTASYSGRVFNPSWFYRQAPRTEALMARRSNIIRMDKGTTYICFHLHTAELSQECRERLENRGVECLSEGEPHKAYGVVADLDSLIEILEQDPEVAYIERGEPPCSK